MADAFTEWRGLGFFLSWGYDNYKCLIDGSGSGISVDELRKMAYSMRDDEQ